MDSLAALPWAPLLVATPLLAVLLAAIFSRYAAPITLTAAIVITAETVALTLQLATHGEIHYPLGGWEPPLGIVLRVDGLTMMMLLMTAAVGLMISLYANSYFSLFHRNQSRHFWPLWGGLWAALNALFLSNDLFNHYVTLELSGLAAVALVSLSGTTASISAAMRYLLVGLAASLAFLLGVGLIYAAYGSIDMTDLATRLEPEPAALLALGLMSAGLLFKGALFPLHFWLPPAHSSAPAPVSAALSALLIKGSFYLLLRLWLEVFAGITTEAAPMLLGVLGAAAILWGSLHALMADRLKLMVAYSTVAQLGYLFLVFPLAATGGQLSAFSGGIYLALSHACAKSAMFLAAGNILASAGHDRIRDLNGTGQRQPLTLLTLAIAGISLIGLPPSGAFLGKWLLLNTAINNGQWWIVLAIITGSLLAGAYVFRLLSHTLSKQENPIRHSLLSTGMEWSALTLALGAIGLGLFGGQLHELMAIGLSWQPPLLREMGQ